MKPTLSIFTSDIQEGDLLFYRPRTFFGIAIKFFDALMYGRVDIAFSHVAIALRDSTGALRRFDAMEGKKTGFRTRFEQCYVFRLQLEAGELDKIKTHCLSRGGSKYDRRGILSYFSPVEEDEFCDYCSELVKNALLKTSYWNKLELEDKKLSPLRLYTILRPSMLFIGLCL